MAVEQVSKTLVCDPSVTKLIASECYGLGVRQYNLHEKQEDLLSFFFHFIIIPELKVVSLIMLFVDIV
jgi:hypothetical protein